MKQTNYLQSIKANAVFIVLLVLLAGSLSLFACGVLSKSYYESKVELLVIQNSSENLDSYAAQKSAEKLGTNLSKIVYSSDFLDKVLATNLVDQNIFSTEPLARKKQWDKYVKAQVVPETGIIKIYGYAEDSTTAKNIAEASAKVLTENSGDYYGGQDSVTIKVIDRAITSNLPAKPNILLNTLIAMAMGLIGSMSLIVIVSELKNVKVEKQELQYQPLSPVFPQVVQPIETKTEVEAKEEMPAQDNKEVNVEDMPFYQVLNHKTYPNLSDSGNSDTAVSMYDHLK